MRSIILTILILLFGCTLSSAQILSADSNHVLVDRLEFKYIVNVFNDFNALREINKQQVLKNEILERIVIDKDKLILLKDEDVQLLKQTIKDISPAWYDKFMIGAATAIVTIVGILITIK